jgi:P pilus assembly chaperone PapD
MAASARGASRLALVLALVCAGSASAQPLPGAAPLQTLGASLTISPRRLTFDAPSGSATITLSRPDAHTTFAVTLVDRAMLPDGRILPLDEVLQDPRQQVFGAQVKSAGGVVTVTPREVAVGPGGQARVQVRLAGADRLPAGEYRTHLTITAKDPSPPETSGAPPRIVFAHSIPVIVRVGPTDVRAGIENARLEYREAPPHGALSQRRWPALVFDLARHGDSSLFGDVQVGDRSGGGQQVLGALTGVGVYPEVERRTVVVPLAREPQGGETLAITFTDTDTQPGTVLATHTLHAGQPTLIARANIR